MTILLVGVVFILVPVGIVRVGGIAEMFAFFRADAETATMVDWGAAGWSQMLAWFFSIFPVWFISIAGFQRIISARDETTARRAFVLTGVPIEWPLFAIGSTLVGMFARMLTPELADAELATPTMILMLLPAGVAGLVIAAYIAALMSTADSCLIGPVAIFVNDIYRKLLRPDATDGELMRVARIATIVLGALAIVTAYLLPRVLDLILYAYTFGAAGLFFPMLGLLFWKRTTASGAFWSIIAGGSCAVVWTVAGEPWVAASYIGWATSCITLIAVSLATSHSEAEDLESFA
jgi:SSS family solute:Na+ symporter